MKEIKVYLVNVEDFDFEINPVKWDDDKFIAEAEIQGKVYSLKGFEEAFNYVTINSSTDIIRIL